MSDLPRRPPRRTHETAEFWAACAEDRLVLPRCEHCAELIWYPRLVCPFCGSHDVAYTEVSGRGTIYARTIMRRGDGPYREHAPYVLAMVRLDEGPTLMTNIVGADAETVEVGQAVRVVFDHVADAEATGRTDAVYRFTPVD